MRRECGGDQILMNPSRNNRTRLNLYMSTFFSFCCYMIILNRICFSFYNANMYPIDPSLKYHSKIVPRNPTTEDGMTMKLGHPFHHYLEGIRFKSSANHHSLTLQPADPCSKHDADKSGSTKDDCHDITIPPAIIIAPRKVGSKSIIEFGICSTDLGNHKPLENVSKRIDPVNPDVPRLSK